MCLWHTERVSATNPSERGERRGGALRGTHGLAPSPALAGIEGDTSDSDAFNAIARENGFRRALAKAVFARHIGSSMRNWRAKNRAQ